MMGSQERPTALILEGIAAGRCGDRDMREVRKWASALAPQAEGGGYAGGVEAEGAGWMWLKEDLAPCLQTEDRVNVREEQIG